jgi:hypothetical protein
MNLNVTYLAGIFIPGPLFSIPDPGSSRKFKYAYPQEGWLPIHHGQGQRQGLQLELHLAASRPTAAHVLMIADFCLTPRS